MHRWDSRLRPPPPGITPIPWAMAGERRDDTGRPSHAQLRGRGWRRSSPGLYVPVDAPQTPEQRVIEVAASLPSYAAIGGWSAAYWMGVRLLDGGGRSGQDLLPVLVNCGVDGKVRRRFGIEVSRERLPDSDVTMVRGVRCTTATRTALDGARLAPTLRDAVVHVDMMLTAGLLGLEELRAALSRFAGWRGIARARRAVSLAVEGSRSPPETRMRLVWVLDAGLPPPLVNPAVYGARGRLLGIPDALDPEAATFLEYDGDDHRDLVNHTADNVREELLEEHGLVGVRVTRLDLSGSRSALVDRMTRTRRRGLARDRRLDGVEPDSPLAAASLEQGCCHQAPRGNNPVPNRRRGGRGQWSAGVDEAGSRGGAGRRTGRHTQANSHTSNASVTTSERCTPCCPPNFSNTGPSRGHSINTSTTNATMPRRERAIAFDLVTGPLKQAAAPQQHGGGNP